MSKSDPFNITNSLEEMTRTAISHGLLSEGEIEQLLESLGEKRESVTPKALVRAAIQQGKLTQLQAKILLSKDSSSLSIGPYLILEKIGQGGMGSVYKARHKSMDRIVALKVLRRRDGFSQDTIKRFQREVTASAKLIHPNIVTAFDAGEQNGIHFLVMEYVSGGDLKSLVDRQGPLTVAKAIDYVQQVARGLQYAHDKQIVHRDIKPANLLLDSEGCVKILDLGLARIIQDQATDESVSRGLTSEGALMGTVDFLSPEQSLDTKTADARSDIYSLGCTLYTLLTGEFVFPAGTLLQRILAHREAMVPSLRLRRPDVPEGLDRLFQQMLSKSPADRPQSMLAVAESLRQLASGSDLGESNTASLSKACPEESFLNTLIQSADDTVKEPIAATPKTAPGTSQPFSTSSANTSSAQPATLQPATLQPATLQPATLQPATLQAATVPATTPPAVPLFSVPATPTPVNSMVRATKGSRRKVKKSTLSASSLGVIVVTLLSVLGAAAWMLSSTAKQRIQLKFSQVNILEIQGAEISIDGAKVGQVDAKLVQEFELANFDRERTIVISKPGFEPFDKTIPVESFAEIDVPVLKRKGNASKPSATGSAGVADMKRGNSESVGLAAGDSKPVVGAAASTSPPVPPTTPASAPSTGPREWIVGIGDNELPDLKSALERARPNDTIRIRHRGPLELSPTDLAGKSPLTIIGDQQGSVDYWPIIRQTTFSGEAWTKVKAQEESAAQPLFFGDQVDVRFEKLHFSIGGFGRERLSSFLRCKSGRVRFEKCTFTASVDEGERFSEGLPLPLVLLQGSDKEQLDLQFSESIIRGSRLKSLVRVTSGAKVTVDAHQWLWAGGQGAFIELSGDRSHASLSLQNSTVYNFASLVDIPAYRLTDNTSPSFLDLNLTNSLLIARSRGVSEFISVSQGEKQSLDRSRWQQLVRLGATHSSTAHVDGWLPSPDRQITLTDFCKVFGLEKPQFETLSSKVRVLPAGAELQESTVRDFELIDQASTKGKENDPASIGIQASKLPATLSRIAERMMDSTTEAGVPRGLPTIVKVSKKNGPIRSLEEAFSQVQGEDVEIVITDNETYFPACNFDIDAKPGILYTESVRHLTIRSESPQNDPPTIVISDSPQFITGTVPGLIHWGDWTQNLFLFCIRSQSLHLDGLQFKTNITRNMRHSVFLTTAQTLRMTNCRILDESSQGQAFYDSVNGYGITATMQPEVAMESGQDGPNIAWIENVMVEHEMQPKEGATNEFVRLATAFALMTRKSTSGHFVFRNCWINKNQTLFFNRYLVPWVEVDGCTISGRLASMHSVLKSIKVRESILFLSPNPVLTLTPGEVNNIGVSGGRNAVWMDPLPIPEDQRDKGPFRLMRGERLVKKPEVLGYKLKGKWTDATTAEDGGPIGFRADQMQLPIGKSPK